ncbi:MAG: hypothetical protein ABSG19_06520 [Candidatus Aminicenantales bacterium]
MHPQVKHARFNLIVCAVTVAVTAAAYVVALALVGPHRARGAFGFLGFLGLLGLGPTFYREKLAEGGVVLDERDKQIADRSRVIAWSVTWLYWCLVCMGVWLWVALRSGLAALEAPFVPAEWPPLVLMAALIVFMMAWSISILVHYRRGDVAGDE